MVERLKQQRLVKILEDAYKKGSESTNENAKELVEEMVTFLKPYVRTNSNRRALSNSTCKQVLSLRAFFLMLLFLKVEFLNEVAVRTRSAYLLVGDRVFIVDFFKFTDRAFYDV